MVYWEGYSYETTRWPWLCKEKMKKQNKTKQNRKVNQLDVGNKKDQHKSGEKATDIVSYNAKINIILQGAKNRTSKQCTTGDCNCCAPRTWTKTNKQTKTKTKQNKTNKQKTKTKQNKGPTWSALQQVTEITVCYGQVNSKNKAKKPTFRHLEIIDYSSSRKTTTNWSQHEVGSLKGVLFFVNLFQSR